MGAAFKQTLLLLRDAIKATIIVDHNSDGTVFLKRRLDRQTTRQKRAVTANQNHIFVTVNIFRRHRERDADTKKAEGSRMQNATKFLALKSRKINGNLRPEMGIATIDHQPILVSHRLLHIKCQLQWMNAPAEFRGACLSFKIGKHLCDPFGPALAI